MLYSRIHMATVGVKGSSKASNLQSIFSEWAKSLHRYQMKFKLLTDQRNN